MNFSRDLWIDDERNTSQVFPWDCEIGSTFETHGSMDSNQSFDNHSVSLESKNYEFESRSKLRHPNYQQIIDMYNARQENERVKSSFSMSQMSLDHDAYYKILITKKDDKIEENDG